jgi:hypothetical protein
MQQVAAVAQLHWSSDYLSHFDDVVVISIQIWVGMAKVSKVFLISSGPQTAKLIKQLIISTFHPTQ